MEKNRKNKLIIIMALIVAVFGMSIGFAVFSNVLTISSSATVTPSEDDFKVVIYGLANETEMDSLMSGNSPDLTKWSTTTSYQFFGDGFESNEFNAIINNSELTISNVSANFTEPGQVSTYLFIIKNEGAYDAYFSISESMNYVYELGYVSKTCTPGSGATQDLVDAACDDILSYIEIDNSSGENISSDVTITDAYKIVPGDYILMAALVMYNGNDRADGPFIVEFDEWEFDFSTAPKNN